MTFGNVTENKKLKYSVEKFSIFVLMLSTVLFQLRFIFEIVRSS